MIKDFREIVSGMISLQSAPSPEEIIKAGFRLIRSESDTNSVNDDVFIQYYEKENLKLIRTVVEHETQSEGTLTYLSVWVDPAGAGYFTKS